MKSNSDVLRAIKIPQEDEVREVLLGLPFVKSLKLPQVSMTEQDYQGALGASLRTGAELRRENYPDLFRLLDSSVERLGLCCEVRCFKGQTDGRENASVWAHEDRVLVTFESGLLSTVDRPEGLQTIIGHELGHYGFQHHRDVARGLAEDLDERLDLADLPSRSKVESAELKRLSTQEADEAFFMFSVLSQICELNADRAGLVARPDLVANIEGEMLLTAGRADRYGRHDARSFLVQGRELIRMGAALEPGGVATHPIGPLRAIAMEYFWRSDRFRDITGLGPADVRLDDFSKVLYRLVPYAELTTKFPTVPVSRKLPQFLLAPPNLGGEGAVSAEGTSPQSGPESAVAETIATVNAAVVPDPINPVDAAEWVDAELIEDEQASITLTAEEKARLAFLLAETVTIADGKLTKAEANFLMTLVRPRALSERILSEYRQEPERFAMVHEYLLDKASTAAGRTKASLVRAMIDAAKADRRIDDEEILTILELAERINAGAIGERELRNAFGTRLDDALKHA